MCEIEYYYEYKWVRDLYRKAGKARKAVADRKMIKDQTIRIRDLKTGVIRVSYDTVTDSWEATYTSPSTSFLKVRYLLENALMPQYIRTLTAGGASAALLLHRINPIAPIATRNYYA